MNGFEGAYETPTLKSHEEQLLVNLMHNPADIQSFKQKGFDYLDVGRNEGLPDELNWKRLFCGKILNVYEQSGLLLNDSFIPSVETSKLPPDLKSLLIAKYNTFKITHTYPIFDELIDKWVEERKRVSLQVSLRTSVTKLSEGQPSEAVAQQLEAGIKEMSNIEKSSSLSDLEVVGGNLAAQFTALQHRPKGVKTGFPTLDKGWNGLNPGLYCIFGVPKSGKSIFGVNLAVNAAKEGSYVLYHANEGGPELVHHRIWSCVSGVPYNNIFLNSMTKQDSDLIESSLVTIGGRIMVNYSDRFQSTPDLLEKKIIQMSNSTGKPGLVIVDLFSYMDSALAIHPQEKDYIKRTKIIGMLKDMADKHGVAIVAFGHTNKDALAAKSGAVNLDERHIGDSTSPAKIADAIGFLYIDPKHRQVPNREETLNFISYRKGEAPTITLRFECPITKCYEPIISLGSGVI
jgi:replicative DNA helicase